MTRYYISEAIHTFIYVSDSIFIGLKFVVPFFFIVWIINLYLNKIELRLLMSSLQWIMLCAGILSLFAISTNTLLAWYSGNEDERSMIISFATGPHWYQFFTPLFNYTILPLILGFRFARKNIYALVFIVLFWYATTYVVQLVNRSRGFKPVELDIGENIDKIIVFCVAITFVFLFVRRHAVKRGMSG